MRSEDAYLLVTALALFLGAIGGIPQIKQWVTPKPHLKILKAKVGKHPIKDKYQLSVEVLNEKKWWRRDKDARYVKAGWYMMDKNHKQWGGIHNVSISPHLLAGANMSKITLTSHQFRPEGNPHTIVVVVECREGLWTREVVTLNV